jgi:exosortase A
MQPKLSTVDAVPHGRSAVIMLAVLLILCWVLALNWQTTASMVSTWERSETYAHGFLIFPIALFLIWRRRERLAQVETEPFLPALFGVAAAGAIWLAGDLANAIGVEQLGMMAMIPFVLWTVLGTRMIRALAFPIAFLFFAIPFGEFLVPIFIDWTADFTVLAIRLSGVPIYRDGNAFWIPSGAWSVVEACSGVRYLIASVVVGCLYAYLAYRSAKRRAMFVLASLLVPIVANWLRAYIIVMMGHLSNNRIATGVDHIVYGWIFFGVVMFLLFLVGSRWREDDEQATTVDQGVPAAPVVSARGSRTWAAVAGAFVVTAIWHPIDYWLDRDLESAPVILAAVPPANGWVSDSEDLTDWRPALTGAKAEAVRTFTKDGVRVGLYLAYFHNQVQGAEAVRSHNELVWSKNKRWRQAAAGTVDVDMDGKRMRTRTAVIAAPDQRLAVWQWYWIDGHVTASDYWAKFYQVVSRLQGHGDPAAWVVVYTPTETDEAAARRVLTSFTAQMSESIDAVLHQAAAPQ